MASLLRPAMLKQTILSSSARRFSPIASALPSTCYPTLVRQSSSWIERSHTFPAKRQTALSELRISLFHSSDPVPVPEPHPTEGSYHWIFERLLALGLIPLTIAPFAAGSLNPTMDALLCASILIHSHIGLGYILITDSI